MPSTRSISFALFSAVLVALLPVHAAAQCDARPSFREMPDEAPALFEPAAAVIARAAAIEALPTTDASRPSAMFQLAEAYRATEALDESIRTLARIVEAHPDDASIDRVLFRLGRALFARGSAERGRAVFFRLVSHYPSSPYTQGAYVAFGDDYAAEDDPAAAGQFYQRAAEAGGPWSAYAHYGAAWAAGRVGDLQALSFLDRASSALGAAGVLGGGALRRAIVVDRQAIAALRGCS